MDDTKIDRSQALRLLYFHFSPEMVKRVEKTANDHKWHASSISLVHVAHNHAAGILPEAIFSRPPSSINDFIDAITPVFFPSITTQIHSNLASFDTTAGVECAENFLGRTTVGDWVLHIIAEFLKPLLPSAYSSASASASLESSTPATTAQSPEKSRPEIPPFDGPSDMFDAPIDRTVKQVTIRGRTVLEAWTTNETTRQLSVMRRGQQRLHHDPENLSPIWTPRCAGSSPVYHGSIVRDQRWPLVFNETPFNALDPQVNTNQMVTDAFGVVFTAFSPLRAFLWAAFEGAMPHMMPHAGDILRTQNTWISDGETYRGVVLFKFNSTQPAPTSLTHYVIPEGTEAEWGRRSMQDVNCSVNEQRVWGHYRDIHGQSGTIFPDLVHGLEYGEQLTVLTSFRTNMWRTIWRAGRASGHLNSQHEATYAISFELDSPIAAPTPAAKTIGKPGDEQDRDKDKDQSKGKGKGKDEKGSKGTLGRRLKNKASSFFRAVSESSSKG